ncbi:HAMP domain-containing sensor histidine kinase [Peredibacter starrii]|uniref:histidine kinase n=1 Tax=Peredibacter starrii TaxID=28202 RepID=A0AAX4HRR1_9BACT|nr:HAMP domain-containing sensor histidine kinase [Peredibacter starrii]WPU65855.1 HAMP domain-containing sensor histidine kinase [Peredibacter starrii]
MKPKSLFRKAYLHIFKLAAVYAVVLTILMGGSSYFFFKKSKTEDIHRRIQASTNVLNNHTLDRNYPSILRDLQRKTLVQELMLYDKNCDLISTNSLSTTRNLCLLSDRSFSKIEITINARKLLLFYRFHYSFYHFLEAEAEYLFFLAAFFYAFTCFVLVSFFRKNLLAPIEELKKSITESSDTQSPNEFSFISQKLFELKEDIRQYEKNEAYFKLAKKVVHDIRNPILALNIMSEGQQLTQSQLKKSIREIDYHINSLLGIKNQLDTFSVQNSLVNIKEQLLTLFGIDLKILIIIPNSVQIEISEFDFKNILMNLGRNSSEAGATEIRLTSYYDEDRLRLHLIDDGKGIPEAIRNKVFSPGFTTKKNGNGIGLSSLKSFLLQVGGDLYLDSKPNCTEFIVEIPVRVFHPERIVFIDDDKFLQLAWKNAARRSQIDLATFSTVDDFLNSSEKFDSDIPIYVDSDLSNGIKGEIESHKIFLRGYKNIHISTSYTDIDIKQYPWIISCNSKTPPF